MGRKARRSRRGARLLRLTSAVIDMPARVTLQLARHVDPEHGRVALSAVHGVVRVSQVAPDQEDPELVRIFVLDIESNQSGLHA